MTPPFKIKGIYARKVDPAKELQSKQKHLL